MRGSMKKRIICWATAAVLTLGTTVPAMATGITATPNNASVAVDGKIIAIGAYNIGGYNYFKLRDVAAALNGTGSNFEVGYDAAEKAISLKTKTAYSETGNELKDTKLTMKKKATVSDQKIVLDGENAYMLAFLIDGYNYFQLRELGQNLGFEVVWDAEANTINIITNSETPISEPHNTKNNLTLAKLTDEQIELFKITSTSFVEEVKAGTMTYGVMEEKQEKLLPGYIRMRQLPDNAVELFREWKVSVNYDDKLLDWVFAVEEEPAQKEPTPVVKPVEPTPVTNNSNTNSSTGSVPRYLQNVLNKYNLTIKEYEKFEKIKNSTYQLKKNYTRQEVINLFVVDMTKICDRPLDADELGGVSRIAAGYCNKWTPDDDAEFIASGEETIIKAEYHSLMAQGLSLEETARVLVKKYPYCPTHTMAYILKNGGAYLPFDVSDFYE